MEMPVMLNTVSVTLLCLILCVGVLSKPKTGKHNNAVGRHCCIYLLMETVDKPVHKHIYNCVCI